MRYIKNNCFKKLAIVAPTGVAAINAGGVVVSEVKDQFYGDRSGMIACPFGYRWFLAAAKEVVSPEEMQERWTKMLEGGQGPG